MEKTDKLTSKQLLAVFISGLAFTATCGVSYFINYYYAVYQEATGFTDGQIGTILSAIGVIAVISYIFGGPLSDKFRSKVLLIFCCLSTAVCSLVMITFPPYEIMLVVQVVLGVCALLPHWSPLCKFITTIGKNQDQTNKIWGIYTAVVGASGGIIGLICTAILQNNDARVGMRITVLVYVALEVFCAVMLPVVDKSKRGDPVSQGGGSFSFKDIARLLTMPKMWLIFLSLTGLYMTGFAFTYIMPLLSTAFLVPLATVTLISTIRGNLIKVVTGPMAGTLAAKLHTSHKANLLLYGVAAVGMILLVVIPWGPGSIVLALVAVALLAVAYSASTTYWTPLSSDAGIPHECLGTAIGFCSVVMTIPDTFAYKLAGDAIEANGLSAYKTILLVVIGCYVVGALANIALIKIRQKELAAEKAAQ